MPTGVYKKTEEQKRKMSKAKRKWYENNPKKALESAKKCSITKKKQGRWKGKDNPNYGSKKFLGIPNRKSWNKGLTKETHPVLKKLSEMNMGEKNPYWKGDKVGIVPLHSWIRRHKPKSKFCVYCNKSLSYDLANISGKYKRDINDYEWLCRKCHIYKDGRINNLKSQLKGG